MTKAAPELELATLVDRAPPGDDWVHEIKLDGYRIAGTMAAGGKVTLWSRNAKDWTDVLGRVGDALGRLRAKSAVLDGEVVALDPRGKSSFQRLQRALGERGSPLVYYVFDLLELDGRDLRRLPLLARKKALGSLLRSSKVGPTIRFSDHVVGGGPDFFLEACRLGAEGIVSKRASAPYRPGRGRDWLKVKCIERQEFVIGGFTEPGGSRPGLGALLLGVYEKGALRYAGRVGTGFDAKALEDLAARLKPLERASPPFADPPLGAAARGAHWVNPKLVAEVAFTEWTEEGLLRHPSFQGLRFDKAPSAIKREKPVPSNSPRTKHRS
jgi:bifunctional non-homologous end joining protein LigD